MSFVRSTSPFAFTRSSVGSCKAPATPPLPNEGPIARTTTFVVGPTMNPPDQHVLAREDEAARADVGQLPVGALLEVIDFAEPDAHCLACTTQHRGVVTRLQDGAIAASRLSLGATPVRLISSSWSLLQLSFGSEKILALIQLEDRILQRARDTRRAARRSERTRNVRPRSRRRLCCRLQGRAYCCFQ